MLLQQSKVKSSRTKLVHTDRFQSPINSRVLEYWNEKRGSNVRPSWSDVELMDLSSIVANVMVRDAVDGGEEFRCRFFGTNLVNAFGHDPTGKLLGEVYDPESAEVAQVRYQLGLYADGPIRIVGFVDLISTNLPMTYEFIMLPLNGKRSSEPEHLLCAFDFDYELADSDVEPGSNPEEWARIVTPL
jgi:hypothetical protein